MKKFSKILTLLLAIVAIVTAFTVVALAEEGTELAPVTAEESSLDFDTTELGVFSDNTTKVGKWSIAEADNGNRYLVGDYESSTGTNGDNWEYSVPGTTYHILDYPTFAFDFDVLSTTGEIDSASSIRIDLYGKFSRITQMTSVKLDGDGISLKSVANVWQHVTYIVKYEGDGVFNYYFYVDGEYTATQSVDYKTSTFKSADSRYNGATNWGDLLDENGEFTCGNVGFGNMIFLPPYKSQTEQIFYDNFKFTYFPAEYSVEDAASYIYTDSYEKPYGFTEAKIGETFYDDVDEALAAVAEGETLAIKTDLEGITIINKEAIIDTNVYNEAGEATGEFYQFTPKSTEGYIITEENGVYTVTKSEENVTVVFDPVCTDAVCTCYGEGVGHRQTLTLTVPVGVAPEYIGTVSAINEEGVVATLAGWSYTKGGEAEELTAVTAEQAAAGTLNLYPVYSVTKYDGALTDASGASSFFMAKDFETALATAIANAGSKIVLYSDIEYYKSFALPNNTDITIDLNGHTLTRVNLYGAVKNYNASTGEYDDGTETTTQKSAFTMSSAKNIHFTMTSSKEGAEFRTVSINGTAYYDADGKLEKYDITSLSGGAGILYYYLLSSAGCEFNFENLDVYALSFIFGSHNGTNTHYVNIENCNFYRTTAGSETDGGYGYDCIFLSGKANVYIKDSLFYFPSSSVLKGNTRFVRVEGTATASVTVDNCDIISDYYGVQTRLASENHTVTYKNSRLYAIRNESANCSLIFDNDVIATDYISGLATAADGCVIIDNTQSVTYTLPTSSRVTLDSETGLPVFEFGFADRDIEFTKEVKLYTEVYVPVTWLDENGEVLKSQDELRYITVTAPEHQVATGDGYVSMVITRWLDADGNEATLELTDADSYTFKANPKVDDATVYVGDITGAMFNLMYYNQFHTALYLPVTEGIEAPAASGFTAAASTVRIDGKEYWSYTKANTTTAASEDFETTVSFTKNGAEYTDVLVTSALTYAEKALAAPESDAEKAAVANMVRYIKEARVAVGLEVSEKFDELIALGGLSELGAANSYADESASFADLASYVQSISFMVDGTYTAYVITLTDTAIAAGAEISVSYVGSEEAIALRDSTTVENAKLTNKTKIYDLVNAISITVTVPAADEGSTDTVVSGTYSIGAYISATDNTLAKATYEFGAAVAAYREYLATL